MCKFYEFMNKLYFNIAPFIFLAGIGFLGYLILYPLYGNIFDETVLETFTFETVLIYLAYSVICIVCGFSIMRKF